MAAQEGCTPDKWGAVMTPDALLRAVRELGGGIAGLAALRRGLRAAYLHLVTQGCVSHVNGFLCC